MNKQELIEKFEQFSGHGSRCYIERNEILNLVKQLDGPEPVKIPQFVADWISFVKTNGLKFKNTYGFYEEIAPSDDVYRVMYYIFKESIADKGIRKWVADNIDTFALAWLDGYEVEEEKRYEVILCNGQSLKTVYRQGGDHLDFEMVYGDLESFTRKRLEEAGFGWVFDCEGVEVEEVE